MSRLVLLEIATKYNFPNLYDIYFCGQVLLHYNEKIPFIVVGITPSLSKEGSAEILSGCKQLKDYHKQIFGIELKSFVTVEEKFLKVKNWWTYFHPRGIYR
nr:hypothetical protein [Neobacillus sp. Marseille-Q6967]